MAHKQEIAGLLELVERAEAVAEAQPHAARAMLASVREECARTGVGSAFLLWRLAVLSDTLGEPDVALRYVLEAQAVDPLALPFRRSREIIVKKLRWRLRDCAEPEQVSALYEQLVRAGEADEDSHLAMARHHAARAEWTAAVRLLEAVTLLWPGSRAAWEALARAARATDQERLAREAEAAAASTGEAAPALFTQSPVALA
jgi:hypothetical protein